MDLQNVSALKRPWLSMLLLSVVVIIVLAYFSSDCREVFVQSLGTVWVILGFSCLFFVEGIVTVWGHREEERTWIDSLSVAIRYLKSPAFVRPLLITYLIFVVVAVFSFPLKMQELRLLADSERSLRSKSITRPPQEVRVTTLNEDTAVRSEVASLSNQLERANTEIEALKFGRLLSAENRAKVIQCLSNATDKGKVILKPAMFDSSTVECASQFEYIFKQAGFDVVFEHMSPSSLLAYDFTGERMFLPEPKPKHALKIQQCFSQNGKLIRLDPREQASESNAVIIAIGGRP